LGIRGCPEKVVCDYFGRDDCGDGFEFHVVFQVDLSVDRFAGDDRVCADFVDSCAKVAQINRGNMQRSLLVAKIHRAVVTDAHLNYEGSLSIDKDLMEAVGMLPYEKILVANHSNGERFETYVIEGERGSRVFRLNGPTARLGQIGDKLTIMAFAQVEPHELANYKPRTITLNDQNQMVS
jgi:aspartate 1-decarboxylase